MIIETENIWQGRQDTEDGPYANRWHHQVSLTADTQPTSPDNSVGLIGFCCDEGVRRNQGRIGAANGPLSFREKFKNIPCQIKHYMISEMSSSKINLFPQRNRNWRN